MKDNKIILYSAEPGGAEIISVLFKKIQSDKRTTNIKLEVYCGPRSAAVFARNCVEALEINLENLNDINIEKNDIVITSACSIPWVDTSEHFFWKKAKTTGAYSIAFLDSWQNYEIRFQIEAAGNLTNEKYIFPNLINCIDKIGLKEIQKFCHDNSVDLVAWGQPYLDEFVSGIQKHENKYPSIFFISEPISEVYQNQRGYDQYESLHLFLQKYFPKINAFSEVFIKLHPRDKSDRFDEIIKNYSLDNRIKIVKMDMTPSEVVGKGDIFFGMTSLLLIQAYLCGKKVYSLQPHLKGENLLVISKNNLVDTDFDNTFQPATSNGLQLGFKFDFEELYECISHRRSF